MKIAEINSAIKRNDFEKATSLLIEYIGKNKASKITPQKIYELAREIKKSRKINTIESLLAVNSELIQTILTEKTK